MLIAPSSACSVPCREVRCAGPTRRTMPPPSRLPIATTLSRRLMTRPRRGAATQCEFRFATTTRLAGLLMSRALEMATASDLSSAADTRPCPCLPGHALEMRDHYLIERTADDYLRSIDGKTASCSPRARAMDAASRYDTQRLAAFGRSVGLHYDLRDISTCPRAEQQGGRQ